MNRKPHRTWKIAGIVMMLVVAFSLHARQFRSAAPIATPQGIEESLPAGAIQIANPLPVPRAVVEPKVREVLQQWNAGGMAQTLAEEFYDRSRLLDVVDTAVPRNASLRMQSLQGTQTLRQYHLPATDGGQGKEVSIVSATVRTQLEFNGPAGLTRIPGSNEFILKISRNR